MRNINISSFDRFKMVYWIIAIATAYHTAWGAATTMQGPQPENAIGWWLQGLAFAAGIDYLMVMVATKLRAGKSTYTRAYLATFCVVATLSFYFQLLYAWAHTAPLPNVGGIAQEWIARLQGIIDARVVIAPLALPLVATLYTIGGIGKGGEVQQPIRKPQSTRNPIATRIAVESIETQPQLEAKAQPKALPGATQLRGDNGKLQAYICPGCKKELSISGWSRHKQTCKSYQEMIVMANGHTNGHHPQEDSE